LPVELRWNRHKDNADFDRKGGLHSAFAEYPEAVGWLKRKTVKGLESTGKLNAYIIVSIQRITLKIHSDPTVT
jgi:hypothetical protein